ncbi:hypothetical protein BGX27_010071 [Mortierella sp. AM989]|nr:hypothetical protein BGX27_010071 [Mortierella sp. AM989]
MAASIRSAAMGLPKVSMTRIPLVAFANSHVAPASHANSAHPSTFSSMSPLSDKSKSWSNSAKKAADQLEQSAQKLSGNLDNEVKQFAEDEILKDVSIAMNATKATSSSHKAYYSGNHHHHNHSGREGDCDTDVFTTFEQLLVDQVHADMVHPLAKQNQHYNEIISSLLEELKSDKNGSSLSQHASDAIRMVESHSILKQDKAPIHNVGEVDPTQKTDPKSKFPF